jgi:CHRD domain
MNRVVQLATVLAIATIGMARDANAEEFAAHLTGFKVVPAILTDGTGKLTLDLNRKLQSISYTLTYSGLSASVTQAHIHFGKEHTEGGVLAFLCSSVGAPAGTPACPTGGGTVTGLITAASVIGFAPQGVLAGDFNGLVRAIGSDSTYADVATTRFPAGEIRGEIHQ